MHTINFITIHILILRIIIANLAKMKHFLELFLAKSLYTICFQYFMGSSVHRSLRGIRWRGGSGARDGRDGLRRP